MKDKENIDLQRWMYFNCPKQFSWIVHQNLNEILKDTKYSDFVDEEREELALSQDDILYFHSVNMTATELTCLLEARDGFYLIHNIKNENEISSETKRFKDLEQFEKETSKKLQSLLQISKPSVRKMTQEQRSREIFPYLYSQQDEPYSLMDAEVSLTGEAGHLDLSYNFTVTSDHLFNWEPKYFVREITFNTCYQVRDFKWLSADWLKDVKKMNFVNMSQLTNRNLEFIVSKVPSLTELYVHVCPQVNIRVLLGVLKPTQLEVLCLDDPRMACQPNSYSGLIKEEEWELFRNRSLKKLLINSNNISLDIIDYLKTSCLSLEHLIIDESKYKYVKENIVSPGTEEPKISVASTKGVKLELGRDFQMKNLLRLRYSQPFSNTMLKVMEKIYSEETEDDKRTDIGPNALKWKENQECQLKNDDDVNAPSMKV